MASLIDGWTLVEPSTTGTNDHKQINSPRAAQYKNLLARIRQKLERRRLKQDPDEPLTHPDLQWENTKTAPYTVFFQGIFCSQTQLAKYTGSRGFESTAGDKVVCSAGIDTIYNPFIGKEIDEIRLKRVHSSKHLMEKLQDFHPVTHIFTGWKYNDRFGIQIETNAEQDETVAAHSVRFHRSSFGQEIDIRNHKAKYDTLVEEKGYNGPIILYGVSRGAATSWNALCTYKYPNVKMVVVEGIFYSIPDILERRFPYGHKPLGKVMEMAFPNFKIDGISPGSLVDDFPEGIPVVFVTSRVDEVVPNGSTKKLAFELARRERNQVYVIELLTSWHPHYPLQHTKDREIYTYGLHAIYKTHGLPYIEEFARQGKDIMERARLPFLPPYVAPLESGAPSVAKPNKL